MTFHVSWTRTEDVVEAHIEWAGYVSRDAFLEEKNRDNLLYGLPKEAWRILTKEATREGECLHLRCYRVKHHGDFTVAKFDVGPSF